MLPEKPNFTLPDFEKLPWEETPYRGVFLYKVEERQDPLNPEIPSLTIMAIKMEPQAIIPLHKHNREKGWTEIITLPGGSLVEIQNDRKTEQVKIQNPLVLIIKAGEIFGLLNINPLKPLYFLSQMEPGFTGYQEIEEIKKDADFPVSNS